MSLGYLYCDPATELDRVLYDAIAAQFLPGPRTRSTAKQATLGRRGDAFRPRLDVHESEETNAVTATVELPGMTAVDVTVEVHQNHLTVSGTSPSPSLPSNTEQQPSIVSETTDTQQARVGKRGHGYVVRERPAGTFSRTLQLPVGVKAEDVKAKMENGVLTITFPKTSPDQLPKRITIE